jgi:CDP-glucose 4,6-dehydratase
LRIDRCSGETLPIVTKMVRASIENLASFYRGRRVLVTGHTGFKGAWLTLWLRELGARMTGVALPPLSPLSMFCAAELGGSSDRFVDIRDLGALSQVFAEVEPEVVFHLAAQSLVGPAHRDPITTFETNLMGTAHVLECIRRQPSVIAAVMITSDKCYQNVEQARGYREDDRLGGLDPYGGSKAAAELLISSYAHSYFAEPRTASIASARAGNVVGGGDWSENRLIPDCARSLRVGAPIVLRRPQATRPWQYVLEPLHGYLLLAMRLAQDGKPFQGPWNFGPPVDLTATVERSVQIVLDEWGAGAIECAPTDLFQESDLLQLDCAKAQRHLGWSTIMGLDETMRMTTRWFKHQHATCDRSMRQYSLAELDAFQQQLDRGPTT